MVESTDVDVHMEQMGGKRALSSMLFVRVRSSCAICIYLILFVHFVPFQPLHNLYRLMRWIHKD